MMVRFKTTAGPHAVGVTFPQTNFAPVLDIHSNSANPVIGKRAFGDTPDAVIGPALAFMATMQAARVLACGKHFLLRPT